KVKKRSWAAAKCSNFLGKPSSSLWRKGTGPMGGMHSSKNRRSSKLCRFYDPRAFHRSYRDDPTLEEQQHGVRKTSARYLVTWASKTTTTRLARRTSGPRGRSKGQHASTVFLLKPASARGRGLGPTDHREKRLPEVFLLVLGGFLTFSPIFFRNFPDL